MLDSVDESKAIVFEESCNDFSVFNMCYLADLLGKSLFAVAVGGVPEFKLLDREGEDYYKTFFDEPSYLQNTTQECYLRLPNCLKNTPYPHWFMSAKERETYHLLWKKFFHINRNSFYIIIAHSLNLLNYICDFSLNLLSDFELLVC